MGQYTCSIAASGEGVFGERLFGGLSFSSAVVRSRFSAGPFVRTSNHTLEMRRIRAAAPASDSRQSRNGCGRSDLTIDADRSSKMLNTRQCQQDIVTPMNGVTDSLAPEGSSLV